MKYNLFYFILVHVLGLINIVCLESKAISMCYDIFHKNNFSDSNMKSNLLLLICLTLILSTSCARIRRERDRVRGSTPPSEQGQQQRRQRRSLDSRSSSRSESGIRFESRRWRFTKSGSGFSLKLLSYLKFTYYQHFACIKNMVINCNILSSDLEHFFPYR